MAVARAALAVCKSDGKDLTIMMLIDGREVTVVMSRHGAAGLAKQIVEALVAT